MELSSGCAMDRGWNELHSLLQNYLIVYKTEVTQQNIGEGIETFRHFPLPAPVNDGGFSEIFFDPLFSSFRCQTEI
jgi:hypothetical protein